MGTLDLRAELCAKIVRAGDTHFPFTHPSYPHAGLMPFARRERIAENPPSPPVDPFAPGIRGGLSVWDVAAVPTRFTEFRDMPAQRIPAFRKTNAGWLDGTMRSFYTVGMVRDGVVVRRPADPWIVDLMPGGSVDREMRPDAGWRLLEAAHALAHRADVAARFRPAGYGTFGALTMNWVTRLAVALLYDLPVDLSGTAPDGDPRASNDAFARYGIVVCDSNAFHTPALRVPCIGPRAPVPDMDVAFVAAGVYIEPHPRGFTHGTSGWLEVNRWSCMPTMVSVAGWELVDAVFHQQPSSFRGSTPEFVVAAPALMPADSFHAYIDAAKAARGEATADGVRVWKVRDFLYSPAYDALIASAPPLPCRECLRLNMRAEGAPGRPDCPPPLEKPDTRNMTYEERQWKEWDDKIDGVLDIIEKAVVYHESRAVGATAAKRARRARRIAANARARAAKRIEVLDRLIARELRNGRPSVAEAAAAEQAALKAALRDTRTAADTGGSAAESTRTTNKEERNEGYA